MKERKTKKSVIAVCLLVLSLVLITVGTTFAFFTYSRQGTTENTLHTGNLTFVYDEKRTEKNKIGLTNAFPISDTNGKALTSDKDGVFDFEIRSTTQGAAINYEIYLTNENSTLPEYAVKTYLTKVTNTEGVENETPVLDKYNNEAINLYSKLGMSKVPDLGGKEGRTLYQGTVLAGQTNYTETYRFRMWIDEEADKVVNGNWKYNGMTFSVRVNVYAQNDTITGPTKPAEYKDESGANYPDLVEGLIPVYYRDGEWRKADLYKEWYDYDIQEWANAVTVVEKTTAAENGHNRDYYLKAAPGTPINMDDINTMWVWIPRYEYNYVSIQDAGAQSESCRFASGTESNCYPNPGAIEINFINGINKQESNDYKMHPAFTFGTDDLTGFWYGKFETSNNEKTCGAKSGSINADCDLDTLTLEIKPNVLSWTGMRVSTAFKASRKMQTTNYTIYGFSDSQDSYDTHMSKNSEWGSVAYLSQSKYGKYGNDTYGENDKEVYINNCSNYITGIAGDTAKAEPSATCTNTYETIQGQKASTTGNITGVYDMSGGVFDYVMGVLDDENSKPLVGSSSLWSSGFNGTLSNNTKYTGGEEIPNIKYYDLYTSNDPSSFDSKLLVTACNGQVCYGHALSETAGWYNNEAHMVGTLPWFMRGSHSYYFSEAGIFASGYANGAAADFASFRLVLTPIK